MADFRLVGTNRTVVDQADFLAANGTRIEGLTFEAVSLLVFFNNGPQSWDIVDGAEALDSEVRAGRVYFSEIVPGYYSLRFLPNTAGYWRVVLSVDLGEGNILSVLKDYEVVAPAVGAGIYSSFFR